MKWFNVFMDFLRLLGDVIAFSMTDPAINARWVQLENDLEAAGFDVPGYEPPAGQPSASRKSGTGAVDNGDGSKSLAE